MARALRNDPSGRTTVLRAGKQSLLVTYPDELVHDAVIKMLQHDVGRLPVVARHDPRLIVGYFGRSSALTALIRQIESEKVREPGWLAGFKRKRRTRAKKSWLADKTASPPLAARDDVSDSRMQ